VTTLQAIDDELWSAIGDPIRRRVLDLLLAEGRATATSLSAELPVSRQAVAKHLAVLENAGLVATTTQGRERRYHVSEDRFAHAVSQITSVGTTWDRRLRRIKTMAEAIQQAAEEQRS
jgi:predicted transcriptional regulator